MFMKIFALVLIQSVVLNQAIINQSDTVIDLLLNGDIDNDNNIESKEQSADIEGGEPIYKNGVWKCGNCDDIDESKPIYSEVYNINSTNINDDRPFVVQVALSVDGMQCVTVATPSGAAVRRESGACAGDAVTLAVDSATHFVVNVF
ncbi:hypothetical protein NE865_05264 [Phthorimaea operculella]|nr:hypothetical protein NE865_05264 [Phthorimaea operculella]